MGTVLYVTMTRFGGCEAIDGLAGGGIDGLAGGGMDRAPRSDSVIILSALAMGDTDDSDNNAFVVATGAYTTSNRCFKMDRSRDNSEIAHSAKSTCKLLHLWSL
jgi:hypothetical protein